LLTASKLMSVAARPADTDAVIIPARTACKLEAIVVIISYLLFYQALLLAATKPGTL